MVSAIASFAAVSALLLSQVAAQQVCNITARYQPVVAPGYSAKVIFNNLKSPRGIALDSLGNILVIESNGGGVRYIKLSNGTDPCVASSKTIVNDKLLNHGIDVTPDGKTLIVSGLEEVSFYPYDATNGSVGVKKVVINGMTNGGYHLTRTLFASRKTPGLLVVQRGSDGNMDFGTQDVKSGRSMARIFNITQLMNSATPMNYSTSGELLGWGLRNSVGFTEAPDGGVWSVENSCDDMVRGQKDVHETNPGEEMNFHGSLANPNTKERGANYGYPNCFAAWDPSVLPDNANIKVGTQFKIDDTGSSAITDQVCQNTTAPRITLPAHTAPLDIKFTKDGNTAYIPFHGSWNRQVPDGYRLASIAFKNGQPIDASTSNTASVDVIKNSDVTKCPGGCFRPVAAAIDSKDGVFMTSDTTGEIFYVRKL